MSDPNPWKARWIEGRTAWHRDEVHPDLHTYGGPWLGERPHRVFVPLCGKSFDVKWLAGQGHDVVAVELSELAVRAMCDEQRIDAEVTTDGPFAVFRAERITIYCGDFFELTADRVGADRVWDRASMIALEPGVRRRYVNHLRTLMTGDWRVLLSALEYDPAVMDGPPFSVPDAEIRAHYATCAVRELHRRDVIDDAPRWREAGHAWFIATMYLIGP